MNNNERKIGEIFLESPQLSNGIVDVHSTKNTLKLKAVLQDADVPNRNNRIYPKSVLQEAIKAPFITEKLKTNSLAGEMNHPPPNSGLQRQMSIDMSNISHFVKEIFWEGNLLMGIVETSANRVGRDFADMIENNNMVCSFSMRGGASVTTKGGYDYVQGPLKIITWDSVHFPSHKKAYMIERLSENTSIDITLGDVTKYISEHSDNFEIIKESLGCFSENINLSIDSGKVLISDKDNNLLGYSLLESNLNKKYDEVLRSLYS